MLQLTLFHKTRVRQVRLSWANDIYIGKHFADAIAKKAIRNGSAKAEEQDPTSGQDANGQSP